VYNAVYRACKVVMNEL